MYTPVGSPKAETAEDLAALEVQLERMSPEDVAALLASVRRMAAYCFADRPEQAAKVDWAILWLKHEAKIRKGEKGLSPLSHHGAIR